MFQPLAALAIVTTWLICCGADELCGIGLGTAGLGKKTRNVVYDALGIGITLIDTAQAQEWYDEKAVGQALVDYQNHMNISTDSVTLVTKIHPRDYGLEKMTKMVIQSKENLQRDSLDLVLLHFPYCQPGQCPPGEEEVDWRQAWKNLEYIKETHDIKSIGVSNFDKQQLEELVLSISNVKVSAVQNWMDPFHQDNAVRQFCMDHQIQYMGYSSFGTQWGRKFDHNVVFYNPVLNQIAEKHSTSIWKVVLSWLVLEGVKVIPRASTKDHLVENFSLLQNKGECVIEPLPLDKSDGDAIQALDGILGQPWDEL